MLLLTTLLLLEFLNQIFDDINLYNNITDKVSIKNKKVYNVFTQNKNGNNNTKLLIENR